MTDIATLGLSVNSKPVEQATDALNKLAAASKTAEAATKSVEASTEKAGVAASGLAKQSQAAAAGITQAAKQTSGAAEAMSSGMLAAIARANAINARTGSGQLTLMGQAIENAGKQAALSSHAMTNLAFQLNDIATMAAMGADPMRILASQTGQLYQILATGEGGVRGSIGYLVEKVAALVTPARAAGGAFLAFGAAAVSAVSDVLEGTRQTNLALIGTGSAAGVTANDIRAISLAAADAGTATVGAARDAALAFAATGKIGAEMAQKLVDANTAFANLFGESTTEAVQRVSKLFSDPAKGVDDLNKRLGAYDDKTVQLVKNLSEQNRTLEAQRVLLSGAQQGLQEAANATSAWSLAWQDLTAKTSKYWDAFGNGLARAARGPSVAEQLAEAQDKLTQLQEGAGRWPSFLQPTRAEVKTLIDEITQLQSKLSAQKAAEEWQSRERQANIDSVNVGDIARRTVPEFAETQRKLNDLIRLRDALARPDVVSKLDAETLEAAQRANDILQAQAEWRTKAIEQGGVALAQAREEQQFALEGFAARTAAQRADLAYRETLAKARREDLSSAEELAKLAKERVLAEADAQEQQRLRERSFAQAQQIEQAQLEVSLIGKTAAQAAGMRAEFDAIAEAKRRAFETGSAISDADVKAARDLAAAIRSAADQSARIKLGQDLQFERDQLGRSPLEQQVYSQLQSAGLLENGRIADSQTELIANQIRFNEAMKSSQDAAREFAGSLVSDFRNGVSASEALGNAMNKLADRFLSMALDTATNQLFSGLSTAFAGGATSSGIGNWTTTILPSIMHSGGVVGNDNFPTRDVPLSVFAGAKRYHNGGVIGADEVPIIAQKGEVVLSRAAVAAGASGGTGSRQNVTIINAQGAYPESIEQIKQALAERDAQQISRDQQFDRRVVTAVRDAQSRRLVT